MLEQVSLFGAFLGGVLSFISPCVLPLVPPYLGYVAGLSAEDMQADTRSAGTSAKVFMAALVFVLGFSTVFVSLGATASVIGQSLLAYSDVLAKVAGVFIIVMGLHFLGVFRIGLFYREARLQVSSRGNLLGAYAMGLAFGFGWTPCIGPVLSSVLFVAGAKETVGQGAILLSAYSLGIGLPFLLAALFARAFLGFMVRFRRHLETVEKVMGGVLVLTGIAFLTGAIQWLSFQLLEWFPALSQVG
ncbi:cytochrome c biogenesis CcdA family protein [Polycladidibacter hongkongensis]|uniref:cytochrome c biogenesis CcdA family protein n=1 Tax=Polycladidibacter hongkongensis TaxID=1647556 RepID=UPI0008321299|nr:cytochrome c biogenesis protein CcdA [Pseudovibrio hongkongensis]